MITPKDTVSICGRCGRYACRCSAFWRSKRILPLFEEEGVLLFLVSRAQKGDEKARKAIENLAAMLLQNSEYGDATPLTEVDMWFAHSLKSKQGGRAVTVTLTLTNDKEKLLIDGIGGEALIALLDQRE